MTVGPGVSVQERIVIATGLTLGLAEWLIDSSFLLDLTYFPFIFTPLFSTVDLAAQIFLTLSRFLPRYFIRFYAIHDDVLS